MVDRLEDLREIKVRCLISGYYLHWQLTEAGEDTFAQVEVGMDPKHFGYRAVDATVGKRWYRNVVRGHARAAAIRHSVKRAVLTLVIWAVVAPAALACPETSIGDLEDEVMCPVCGTSLGLADRGAPGAARARVHRAPDRRLQDQGGGEDGARRGVRRRGARRAR